MPVLRASSSGYARGTHFASSLSVSRTTAAARVAPRRRTTRAEHGSPRRRRRWRRAGAPAGPGPACPAGRRRRARRRPSAPRAEEHTSTASTAPISTRVDEPACAAVIARCSSPGTPASTVTNHADTSSVDATVTA
ncbi:hypothetical protein EIL87_22210 [Saccharopolyspora rhizosphaerae]|uniref:Uncharacterized protein n=1 Tax=Saccharopolyspora rhizosphaerae TaxID=2492662 RepID=A0A3R8NUQ4_9PSEU|nr:hypothetical protein EIL87_22210 [Saccharopolyspora rhizosphaerae]